MDNSLDNQNSHDIIKDLVNIANEKYQEALAAVHSRLLEWAGLVKDRRHKWVEAPKWLVETAELYGILKDFRRLMGLKEQTQGVYGTLFRQANDGTKKIVVNKPGIRNWQCGMCQMIDTQNTTICEVLPVLLTAYVYNFPDNDLVHQFLDRNPLERGLEKRDEYIYGVERYPEPNLDEATGFERLMFEQVIECHDDRDMIQQISKFFSFRNFSPYYVGGKKLDPVDLCIYFLPKEIKSDFIKNCTPKKSMGHNFISEESVRVSFISVPVGFSFYHYHTLLEIFGYFYTAISRCAKQKKSHFIERPNPLFCWILINRALRYNKELDLIKENCNKYSMQELKKIYDNHIREIYTQRLK